jgi:hypothetical protein
MAEVDGAEEAYAAGYSSGAAAGESLALEDGARLGALHGAALGSELGALEGFTLALSLLAASDGLGSAPDHSGEAAGSATARRVRRAAAQVGDRVAPLGLAGGGPVPEQAGVYDTVQQCRAAAKMCCTAAGFPAAAADFEFRSSGVGVGVGVGGGGAAAPPAATPLAARAEFSF